jgi:hypothetical protein
MLSVRGLRLGVSIPLPCGRQTFAIWGKLFTHIHDQEIEISEGFYLDLLT